MSYTNIGTTIAIGSGTPATHDAAGFAALTYIEVVGVASIPELGASSSIVSQADLKDGVVIKDHGEVDFGGGNVQMREVVGDAGQLAIKNARENQTRVPIKITRASGVVEYAIAIFTSFRKTEATTGNFFGISSEMQITSSIVEVAA